MYIPIPIPIPSQHGNFLSKRVHVWAIPTRASLFAISISECKMLECKAEKRNEGRIKYEL